MHITSLSLRQAFPTLHTAQADETFDIDIHNQDLSGFFTSISTERFLASLNLMTQWYSGKKRNTRHSIHSNTPRARPYHASSQRTRPIRKIPQTQHPPDTPASHMQSSATVKLLFGWQHTSPTNPGSTHGLTSQPTWSSQSASNPGPTRTATSPTI